jgi:four helix bundle protein
MNIRHFRDLDVYKKAKSIALEIYDISKTFPAEERYSLTDQIRRCSRSACANLAEAWRRRRYEAAFIAKINDCEAECSETEVWLEFALAHGYISEDQYRNLEDQCEHTIAMLVKMATHSKDWVLKKSDVATR